MLSYEELQSRFTPHAVSDEAQDSIKALRTEAIALADEIARRVPDGTEQAVALTHLETAIFWAVAGIARKH